ncbi:MAG: DUF1778 domain-containing protein [Spirochaetaceae bacterium]|nr:DUF1778 domain-containing protein [Spirochaetaceae bacterium]MDT8298921.1 DUF1778 domain-containing protein [Spirochaetaceae bacterium]
MRISTSVKEVIEKAAVIKGKSLSSYAISTLQDQAQKDIQEYETLTLDNQERDRFLDLMANPPKPNDALKSLMRG